MNLFRLAGDMTHLLSIIVLLLKIRTMKSCAATLYLYLEESFSVLFQRTKFYCRVMFEDDRLPKLRGRWEYGHLLSIRHGASYCMYSILNSEKSGISLKTQELYIVVFATRYLDLFTRHVSYYNTIMKLVFLGTSIAIVWYMRYHKVVKQTYNKDEDTFKHYFLIPPCFVLALMVHRAFDVVEVLWSFSLYLEAVAILPQLVLLQRSRNIDNLTGNYVFLLGAYRGLYLINWIYRFFMEKHQVRWIPWLSGLVQTALYADFFYYYIQSWKNHEKLKLPD